MNKIIILPLVLLPAEMQAQHKPTEKPNIVWIVCEDISPFIGSYGYAGVKTPNIDRLAAEGIRYTHAYTTAGVSAPSRSAIITGMYQTSIGTQHMRTAGDPKYQPVPPYSAVIPAYVKCFPEYLRKAGYYCTNNEKQDYQFVPPVTVWDENAATASFLNRPEGKPFFSVFNFFITHESQLFSRKDSLTVDPAVVSVPPIYPDTKSVRYDIARMLTNIEKMDEGVGELLGLLKKEGLYDNTIIFFYSDHGGVLPWMKREILERGTHIPLIIRYPGAKDAGTINDDLVSSVDFAPSVLSLTGIEIPHYMQGQPFLGDKKSVVIRKYVFAARDRMDTEYDRVRMVRSKSFRYLYNYSPEKPYYQNIAYRLDIPMMKEILRLRDEGKLDRVQMSWFGTKPGEELYDVEKDPYETNNLANNPDYATILREMRLAFRTWSRETGDMSATPENEMVKNMWNGSDTPPLTAEPGIIKTPDGISIECKTPGASIGYRILKNGSHSRAEQHMVETWDMQYAFGLSRNGTMRKSELPWNVYKGEPIKLSGEDTLEVNSMRIGFRPSVLDYSGGRVLPH